MTIPRDLGHDYVKYCRVVSSPQMALSMETSILLWQTCEAMDATNVADFGSGWSSYVLRRWAAAHDGVKVTSVDDNDDWLTKTAVFLAEHDLNGGELVSWEEYQTAPPAPHDVVLHDLAGGMIREDAMPLIAQQVRLGGMAIFDDAQHAEHRAAMRQLDGLFDWIDVQRPTTDAFGRYAMLGVRK